MTTILLPLPPRELSSNGSHGNWRKHAKAVKEYRELCLLEARVALVENGIVPETVWKKRRLSLTFGIKGARTEGRYAPRDIANGVSAAKALIDSLVDVGLLCSDSYLWTQLGDCTIDAKTGPWVEVTIEDS